MRHLTDSNHLTAYRHFPVPIQDADLDVLCASLYYLQQAFDGEFNGLVPGHVILVVLLQKFANGLCTAADSSCLKGIS